MMEWNRAWQPSTLLPFLRASPTSGGAHASLPVQCHARHLWSCTATAGLAAVSRSVSMAVLYSTRSGLLGQGRTNYHMPPLPYLSASEDNQRIHPIICTTPLAGFSGRHSIFLPLNLPGMLSHPIDRCPLTGKTTPLIHVLPPLLIPHYRMLLGSLPLLSKSPAAATEAASLPQLFARGSEEDRPYQDCCWDICSEKWVLHTTMPSVRLAGVPRAWSVQHKCMARGTPTGRLLSTNSSWGESERP